ncbi:putative Zn peptidase [Frankia canadensis]|uniref:Putative Zn peptidase n=1 Tax=Frankia canadensis TaxID=1836972 RepID=A0A2I2KZC3_9ACTN|nr:XRE family transcriptional regulator [Frankia canadensis]SNQ51000.1 putative Zn peptidase [Frankia canadensis]SOU58290.1 putative Zn peptidase [Frankia canadensis]
MEGAPGRVLNLIEGSGQSRRAFGQDVGLDDSKLSKSLSGARRFSSLDLARIADKCGVTIEWLLTGEEPALALAARTTTGQQACTVLETARKYSVMREDLATLGRSQPWRPVDVGYSGGTYAEQGRALASAALVRTASAGLSVTDADLPALVETAFGADVAVVILDDGFDGLCASSDDAKLIVLGASAIPVRQRFTLAHELGHLLAGDDQDVHLDKDIYERPQEKDSSEMRANAFASAFLMPEGALRETVGRSGLTVEGFAALACDFKVAPSALAIRLQQLRLIDAGTCDRFRTLTAAKVASIAGRSEEFARGVADASAARPPGLLVRDAYLAYESGATTIRLYANLLGIDADELGQSLDSSEGRQAPDDNIAPAGGW